MLFQKSELEKVAKLIYDELGNVEERYKTTPIYSGTDENEFERNLETFVCALGTPLGHIGFYLYPRGNKKYGSFHAVSIEITLNGKRLPARRSIQKHTYSSKDMKNCSYKVISSVYDSVLDLIVNSLVVEG